MLGRKHEACDDVAQELGVAQNVLCLLKNATASKQRSMSDLESRLSVVGPCEREPRSVSTSRGQEREVMDGCGRASHTGFCPPITRDWVVVRSPFDFCVRAHGVLSLQSMAGNPKLFMHLHHVGRCARDRTMSLSKATRTRRERGPEASTVYFLLYSYGVAPFSF